VRIIPSHTDEAAPIILPAAQNSPPESFAPFQAPAPVPAVNNSPPSPQIRVITPVNPVPAPPTPHTSAVNTPVVNTPAVNTPAVITPAVITPVDSTSVVDVLNCPVNVFSHDSPVRTLPQVEKPDSSAEQKGVAKSANPLRQTLSDSPDSVGTAVEVSPIAALPSYTAVVARRISLLDEKSASEKNDSKEEAVRIAENNRVINNSPTAYPVQTEYLRINDRQDNAPSVQIAASEQPVVSSRSDQTDRFAAVKQLGQGDFQSSTSGGTIVKQFPRSAYELEYPAGQANAFQSKGYYSEINSEVPADLDFPLSVKPAKALSSPLR
jgi:hypothetical protein